MRHLHKYDLCWLTIEGVRTRDALLSGAVSVISSQLPDKCVSLYRERPKHSW